MDTAHELLILAQRALSTNQEGLGRAAGASRRTVQRWVAGSQPVSIQFHALARAVYPLDAALAARLAERGGTTLAALGLGVTVASASASLAPPGARSASVERLVDALVCAAADAMELPPRAPACAARGVLDGA